MRNCVYCSACEAKLTWKKNRCQKACQFRSKILRYLHQLLTAFSAANLVEQKETSEVEP